MSQPRNSTDSRETGSEKFSFRTRNPNPTGQVTRPLPLPQRPKQEPTLVRGATRRTTSTTNQPPHYPAQSTPGCWDAGAGWRRTSPGQRSEWFVAAARHRVGPGMRSLGLAWLVHHSILSKKLTLTCRGMCKSQVFVWPIFLSLRSSPRLLRRCSFWKPSPARHCRIP